MRWRRSAKGASFTTGASCSARVSRAIVIFEVFAHLFHVVAAVAALRRGVRICLLLVPGCAPSRASGTLPRLSRARRGVARGDYWKLAGIATSVANSYPIKQPSELAWVKIVLRTLDMLHVVSQAPKVSATVKTQETVRELWVNAQKSYFERHVPGEITGPRRRWKRDLSWRCCYRRLSAWRLAYLMGRWHVAGPKSSTP